MEKDRNYTTVLNAPEAEVIRQFIQKMLIPNMERIRTIAGGGDVVVIFYEPLPSIAGIFPSLGGLDSPIFPMSTAAKTQLSEYEAVTRDWIARPPSPGVMKVFAIIHEGTFLFNWSGDHGLEVEPGSTDAERALS